MVGCRNREILSILAEQGALKLFPLKLIETEKLAFPGLKGPVQDRAFAGVHAIKTNTWSFGTLNMKQFRSVQLSKPKRILAIVISIVFIDSN